MRHPVNIGGWIRHQVRGLGSLLSAVVIVLGVLLFAMFSMNPPDYEGRLGAGEPKSSAEKMAAKPLYGDPAQLYLQASSKRPIPLVAEIEVFGWKSRTNSVVDAGITSVEAVEVDPATVKALATAYPVREITEQLRGKRVFASVGPRAASVLPSSGKARVDLVVTPNGKTATVVINDVIEPVRSAPVRVAANVPQPAGARASGSSPAAATPPATNGAPSVVPAVGATVNIARVETLSVYWGAPGTAVVMNGRGFGASAGSNWVSCDGKRARIISWSDTSIRFVVPAAMTRQGYVGAVIGGRVSNGVFFSPFSPPKITSITPREGAPGTTVTLLGSGFGRTQQDGWVTFSGSTAQVLSWSDSAIRVLVPRGATSGYAGVVAHGMTSNGILYGPLGSPLVSSVSRRVLLPDDVVTITGRGFGVKPGVVVVNGTRITASSWSPTEVRFTVPARLQGGYVGVVRSDSWTSNGVWVPTAPRMLSLSRWWAEPGSQVELRGVGFGSQQGSQSVFVGGVVAPVTSWSDTLIVAEVPATAAAGYVGVGTRSACSNGVYLLVETRPHITTAAPLVVRPGDHITISGFDFGSAKPSSRVVIAGSLNCQVVSWSDTSIEAVVPAGVTMGYVGVVKRGVSSNGVWVIPAP